MLIDYRIVFYITRIVSCRVLSAGAIRRLYKTYTGNGEDDACAMCATLAPPISHTVEQAWLIKASKGKPRGLFIFGFSSGSCAPSRQFVRVMRFLAASDSSSCSKNS